VKTFSRSGNQQTFLSDASLPTRAKQDMQIEVGNHEAVTLVGGDMLQVLQHLDSLDPQLGRFILQDGFGDIFANSIVGYREWALLSLAALMAAGDTGDQLEMYLKAAIQHGAIDDEILDIINLVGLHTGTSRALNASRLLVGYLSTERNKRLPAVTETVVHLGDHDTIVWDNHGDGPPIVLLHALSLDHRMWRDVYPHLAAVGRVITYDLRGHGRARGAPKATSLDQLANDTQMLLDILEIEQADVYGASYGGAIAQHIALNYPERVRSLAIIATFSKAPQALLESRAEAAERDGMEAQVGVSLMRWFFPATIAQNGWAVRYARECIRHARVEDWTAAWRTMARLDVFDKLGQLQMPTLVTGGKNDLSTTPDVMLEIARAIPNAIYKLIDPGTHMMILEQPAALSAELVAFRKYIDTITPPLVEY
jgi:3-oxoadipate enol-lactonase